MPEIMMGRTDRVLPLCVSVIILYGATSFLASATKPGADEDSATNSALGQSDWRDGGEVSGENGERDEVNEADALTHNLESTLGETEISPGLVASCFRRNGTLSAVAINIILSWTADRASKSRVTKPRPNMLTTIVGNTEDATSPGMIQNDKRKATQLTGGSTDDTESRTLENSLETSTTLNPSRKSSSGPTDNRSEMHQAPEDTLDDIKKGSTCTLRLTIPEMTFARLQIVDLDLDVCAGLGDVFDTQVRQEMLKYCGEADVYLSTDQTQQVSVTMETGEKVGDDRRIHVRIYGGTVLYLASQVKGFVNPQPLLSAQRGHPSPWVVLRVPDNHRVMLSLQEHRDGSAQGPRPARCGHDSAWPFQLLVGNLTTFTDHLTVYGVPTTSPPPLHENSTLTARHGVNASSGYLYEVDCTSDDSLPEIFSFGYVFLLFKPPGNGSTDEEYRRSGLDVNLHFSFHPLPAVPERSDGDGVWNCSWPRWAELQHHFPCDLRAQCRHGEDEALCPYTSQRCGTGFLDTGGRCYYAINTGDNDLTWLKANEACSERGGYLVSPNFPGEMSRLLGLLQLRPWVPLAYVGLRAVGNGLPRMYRRSWQWADTTIAHQVHVIPLEGRTCGAIFINTTTTNSSSGNTHPLATVHCSTPHHAQILCESSKSFDLDSDLDPNNPFYVHLLVRQMDDPNNDLHRRSRLKAVDLITWHIRGQGQGWAGAPFGFGGRFTVCPAGHLSHTFLACDLQSSCYAQDYVTCRAPLTPLPPMFRCTCADEVVAYSVVCDHRSDCQDNSDEDFCVFPACTGQHWFRCSSHQQCVLGATVCNGQEDCEDGSDEGAQCQTTPLPPVSTPPLPFLVSLTDRALLAVDIAASRNLTAGLGGCPNTHFTCSLDHELCLPAFLLCNGIPDCPGQEDEVRCQDFTCPGFYRCRDSTVCLHPDHICDGLFQCPQHDDEALCHASCPHECLCYGLAFICRSQFETGFYTNVRYLDVSGTGMGVHNLSSNHFLVHLVLSKSGLTVLRGSRLPNLRILDLSDNRLRTIDEDFFLGLDNLYVLNLSGNPLQFPLKPSSGSSEPADPPRAQLHTLDLSRVRIRELAADDLEGLGGLHVEVLNLSHAGIERLSSRLDKLRNLRVVDLRGCPLHDFPLKLLRGLDKLQLVMGDNYRLCCRAALPAALPPASCLAPHDQLSSCQYLLRSDYYRLVVYLYAAFTLLGNVCSLLYRFCVNRRDSAQTSSVFVLHMCMANLLTGVYLLVLAVADWRLRGSYVWGDREWRDSRLCRLAGFLFLLSFQVSLFLTGLMTFDRFLVLRHPLSAYNFRKWSAHAAAVLVWLGGAVVAAIPLLPHLSRWRFYGHSGICIPLPGTSGGHESYPGRGYAFVVFSVVTVGSFLVVAPAQALIYTAIKSSRHALIADKSKKHMDLAVSSRLLAVVMVDHLTWVLVGLVGLLGRAGLEPSPEVEVLSALVVLPLHAALNPYIYTLSMARDLKQARMRERIREDVLWQARQARLLANETRITNVVTRV